MNAEAIAENLKELGVLPRWVCGVVRSGYHNGAGCHPNDAHEGWHCGWRLEASIRCDEHGNLLHLLDRRGRVVNDRRRIESLHDSTRRPRDRR